MKKLIVSVAVLLMSLNSFAGMELEKLDDDNVSAAMIQGQTSKNAGSITTSLTTVYIGGAAGLSKIIITIYDDGPNGGGDYQNTTSYSISNVNQKPKSVSLKKIDDKNYTLSLVDTAVSMDKDANWVYEKQQGDISIKLDDQGTVVSADMVTKNK